MCNHPDDDAPARTRKIPCTGLSTVKVRVDVEIGPAYRASLDVLELVDRLCDLLPSEHDDQRIELKERSLALTDMMLDALGTARPPIPGT